jgi:hypothetical protein
VSTFADCARYADAAATWPAVFTAQQLPRCAAALQATGALPDCLAAAARKAIAAPAESTPLAVFAALAGAARSAQDAAAVLSLVLREMRSQSELTEAMLAEGDSSSATAAANGTAGTTAADSSAAAVTTLLFARMSPLLLLRVLPVPALALALSATAATASDADNDDDIAAELVTQLDRRLLRVYEYETVSKLAAEALGRLPPHFTVPAALARISAYTDSSGSSSNSSAELQALPSGLLVPASARASRSAVVLCAAAAVQPQRLHSCYAQEIAAVMVTAMSATATGSTDTAAAAAAATALEKVQRGCIDCCARLLDSKLNSSTTAATTAATAAGVIGELCVTVGIRGESLPLCTALQQPLLQLRICLVNVLVSAAKACNPAKLQCLAELHGLLEACVTAGTASISHTDAGKADYSEEQQQQQLQAACLQAAFVLLLRGHSLYHYTERADALLLDLAAVVAAAAAGSSSRRSEVVRLGALKLLSAAVAALTVDASTTATSTATAAAVVAVVADSTLQRVAAVLLELQRADESAELRSLAAVALQTLLQDKLAQHQQVQSFDADADNCE